MGSRARYQRRRLGGEFTWLDLREGLSMDMNSGARKPGNRLRTSILALVASSVVTLLVAELFFGYMLWIQKSGNFTSTTYYAISALYSRIYGTRQWIFYSPKSPYVADNYLGYSDLPGLYNIQLRARNGTYHSWTSTVNEKGNRITSFSPELYEGKKEIWIFGDSGIYGWGNNDETTCPFFLQQFLPNYCVVNYADNGYSNLHAYLQLKRELKQAKTSPEVIVIGYAFWFRARNVAAPSQILTFGDGLHLKPTNVDLSTFLHPRGALGKDGKLEIDYVPMFARANSNGSYEKDPSEEYQYDVTYKILKEIYTLSKTNGAKSIILAFISGEDSDKVIPFAKETGYEICDIRPKRPDRDRYEQDSFSIYDSHAGPLSEDNYAIKLYKTISKIVPVTRATLLPATGG